MRLYRVAGEGVEALFVVAESVGKAVEHWVVWMEEYHPVNYSPNLEPQIVEVVAEDQNVSVGYASGLSQSMREDLDYAWTWFCNISVIIRESQNVLTDGVVDELAIRLMASLFQVHVTECEQFKRQYEPE